ncbi:MAG: MBL fold metallo-hydrolase [Bacteroidia bacterium]|nr:MBL fold metallo-hydrolase [Bacteroidia bacterium]
MKSISNFKLSAILISLCLWVPISLLAQTLPENVAKIGENIYSYGGYGEYFSMFIVTSEGVIAIESVDSKHASGMLEAIKEVTDQPIKYLLHSHNHWDHASGAQVFKDAGAKTLAHVEAYEWMKANTGRDMAIPDESWAGSRKDISLGDMTIELHYLGMNHGLGMTVFLIPDQKIAYIADLVTPKRVLMSVVPDFNIREWERSLAEIIEMDFEKAVYSHNESENALQGGDKQDARDNLQFIKDIRAGIYAEFQKGTYAYSIPSILKLPQYKGWAMYEEWLSMNIWRVLLDEYMGPFPWRPDHEYQDE